MTGLVLCLDRDQARKRPSQSLAGFAHLVSSPAQGSAKSPVANCPAAKGHLAKSAPAKSAPSMGSPSQEATRMFSKKFGKEVAGIDPAVWGEALRRRHPAKTAEAVAAETGLSPLAVRKWVDGVCAPSAGALVSLIAAYGPEFLKDIMPRAPRWLEASARAQEYARLEAEQARLERRLQEIRTSCAD